jgi:poly-gamma-glutamate synthesis protein (capsule biosynthesis protein)
MLYFFTKKYQNFRLFISIIFLLVILFGSFFLLEFKKFDKEFTQFSLAQISIPLERETKPITLIFVGDIMFDRGVELKVNKYGQENWKFPFMKIADDLKKADILFGNLEDPISDKGRKVGSIYSFRADPKVIEGLNYAGFDVLSVANNHIFDYSKEAMEDTFSRLKRAGIDYVGGGFNEKEAHSSVIKEVNGIKIGFLAYTNLGSEHWIVNQEKSGITRLTKETLERDLKEAKKKADLVVVSFHFGDEYQSKSNSTQQFWAHLAIDSGADLIIGHHPHVTQEIEEYKGKYIAYSLGNFVFDQSFSEETMQGLLLKVIVKNAKIKEVTPINIQINKFFQPEIIKN